MLIDILAEIYHAMTPTDQGDQPNMKKQMTNVGF